MVSGYSHTKYVLHYFTETNNNLFYFSPLHYLLFSWVEEIFGKHNL